MEKQFKLSEAMVKNMEVSGNDFTKLAKQMADHAYKNEDAEMLVMIDRMISIWLAKAKADKNIAIAVRKLEWESLISDTEDILEKIKGLA